MRSTALADAIPPHATRRGDPYRPALVLIHTIGTDGTLWDALLPHLPETLHILRLDLRGHGQSPHGPPPGRIGAYIRDVEHTLDTLDLRDTALLGHGFGGLIAQGLATKRLDLVRALILSGTATKMGTRDRWTTLAQKTRQGDSLAPILATAWRAPKATPAAIRTLAERIDRQDPETLAQAAEAIAGADFYTTTAALRLPTLALVGDRDTATPVDLVRETADLVPGSTVERIPRAGHLAMIDAPADYAAALTAFLDRIGHL